MKTDKFLYKISQIMKDFKAYMDAREDFIKDMSAQLTEFIVKDNPALQNDSDKLCKLKELSDTYALMALEAFRTTLKKQESGEGYERCDTLPALKTRETAQQEINKILQQSPAENHEFVKEMMWKHFEQNNQWEQYQIDVHNLFKKVLIDHFEEDILQFDSQYFHCLDEGLFLLATYSFIKESSDFI